MITDRYHPTVGSRASEVPADRDFTFRGAKTRISDPPADPTNSDKAQEYADLFKMLASIPEGKCLSLTFKSAAEATRQRNLIRIAGAKRKVNLSIRRTGASSETIHIMRAPKPEAVMMMSDGDES